MLYLKVRGKWYKSEDENTNLQLKHEIVASAFYNTETGTYGSTVLSNAEFLDELTIEQIKLEIFLQRDIPILNIDNFLR